MKAALYARVSTSDKGQQTENQTTELRRYCIDKQLSCIEYIEEETATGKKRRPVFEQMLADAEQGRFRLLVIWALDRLTREGPLRAMLLLDRLNRAGVKVKSLKEPWLEPESPTYELLLPIFAWIAKQEALRMSERVRAGLAQARANGQTLGRPKLGLTVEQLRKVALLREGRSSWEAIGHVLGMTGQQVRSRVRRAVQKGTQELTT